MGFQEMAFMLTGTTFPTGKECDLNRQCGVINPETKKICTRLLTCKVTPISTAWRGRLAQTQDLSEERNLDVIQG